MSVASSVSPERQNEPHFCCPNSVTALGMSQNASASDSHLPDVLRFFSSNGTLASGSLIATTDHDLQIRITELAMQGELTKVPTDALIDMLYIILAGDMAITASDAAEIERIQRELQRRGGAEGWSTTVN